MDVETLIANPPRLHPVQGGTVSWAIPEALLRHLDAHLAPGMHTIETGAGVSTLAFAIKGCIHTAIAPSGELMQNIREYCAAHAIDPSNLTLKILPSEVFLPQLPAEPSFDVALIDGRHGFPAPFIDYHYMQAILKVGGLLIVDDIQLWTGEILRDFMREEPGWTHLGDLACKTSLFRKEEGVRPRAEWSDQPYITRLSRATMRRNRWATVRQMLREGRWGELKGRIGRRLNNG
jgi:hypothetical protein